MCADSLDRQLESLELQVRSSHDRAIGRELLASVPDDAVHVIVVMGKGAFRSERCDWTPLQHGDVVVLPRRSHQWFVSSSERPLKVTIYDVAVHSRTGHSLLELLEEPMHEHSSSIGELAACFASVDAELARPQLGSSAVASLLMKYAIALILRANVQRCGAPSVALSAVHDARLRRAISHVLADPSAPHTVSQLATVAGMSRSAFARHFFESVKQSPMEFVKQIRLEEAAALLRSTDLPVKSVAARTGYASRSHFSRAFRAAFDVDPSRFRKAREEQDKGTLRGLSRQSLRRDAACPGARRNELARDQ